ncbi:MAG: hypothetical protein WC261_02965 [Synergistaceae bacterium]|jgi:hypothetical protein
MGELESEILCAFFASVVNRYALTQAQSLRGTEAVFFARPCPHNSAKSQKVFITIISRGFGGNMPNASRCNFTACIAIMYLLFISLQCGQSLNYSFENSENTIKWGTIAIEETDKCTHNHAMKLYPTKSKTVFVKRISLESAERVRFEWMNNGKTPSIFELVFLIDNETKNINNTMINKWVQTEKFQINYKDIHNITWYYKLKDNFGDMGQNLWDSSCWIDNVEFEGMEIIREPFIENQTCNINSVAIRPENGSPKDTYKYFVHVDEMNEEIFDSLFLEVFNESETWRITKRARSYNNSCCVFEIKDLSNVVDNLGTLRYEIFFKNKSIELGNGPEINILWTDLLGKKENDNSYKYNISLRSTDCPIGISLCYSESGEKKKAGTHTYNSCGKWEYFEWIDLPKYEKFWVVNKYECS